MTNSKNKEANKADKANKKKHSKTYN